MGNPVAHSLSPRIHQLFASQCDISLHYQAICVEPEDFPQALDDFQSQGGRGLNITLPFKQQAYENLTKASEKAAKAGAVNTIWFGENGERYGDTTDGIGLIRDLQRHRVTLEGKKVLVLGAGGAVRSVLGDLIAALPREITLANRSLDRAQALAEVFSDVTQLKVLAFSSLVDSGYDVIINGTAAGLQGESLSLPEGLLKTGGSCYDMVYAAHDTPFVSWAKSHAASVARDGLGMLVEQAAESFYIWHALRPDVEVVLRELRG